MIRFQPSGIVLSGKKNKTDHDCIDAEYWEIEKDSPQISKKTGGFYQTVRPPHKVIRIRPDTSVKNRNTEDIARSIADTYKIPLDRFYFADKWQLRLRDIDRATWEMEYRQDGVDFLFTVPEDRADIWLRRLSGIWEKATITIDLSYSESWQVDQTVIYELVYRKHDMYSLLTNSRNNLPLPSLLQALKMIGDGDKAKAFALFEPVGRQYWNAEYKEAWEKLRNGRQPMKNRRDARNFLKLGLICTGQIMQETMTGIAEIIKTDQEENIYKNKTVDPEAGKTAIENLSADTKHKGSIGAIRTYLWVIAQSTDKGRREGIARTLTGAFADLAGDNELEGREVKSFKKKQAILDSVCTKAPPSLKFTSNVFSTAEVGKIIQLPGRELQENYPEIDNIKIQEVVLPNELFGENGIPLGNVTERGKVRTAKLPISDHDIECKTEINYGNMGCGKTGRGIVVAVHGVKNGRTVFFFDMADGQAIDAVRDALPLDMPDEKIIDLDFGNKHWPIPLTLTDVAIRQCDNKEDDGLMALDAAEKMTDYIYTFINQLATSEFSDRMEYFLSPIGKGILADPKKGLLEIILALTSPTYRDMIIADKAIQEQPEVLEILKLLQQKAVKGTDKTLVQPILDRLNLLAGKRTLANIFLQPEKLDSAGKPLLNLRELMDNKGERGIDRYGYFVGIRIPKAELGKSGVNRVASFMMAKIWLATLSRIDTPQDKRHPFYTIIDEPHNCLEGTGPLLDGEIGVEARKYRNKMVLLAHSVEQMGKYKAGIYAGGPFFNFFKTEYQKTFLDHAEKLKPLEVKNLYEQLPKRWVAACKMELPKEDSLPAFICHMTAPPKAVKDRYYRRKECSEKYGRYWREVTELIQNKKKIVLQDEAWREDHQEEKRKKRKS